jgi:2-polyprenyl-3-methyl-5-hydroxy-6-metoxy-1,4-benzoquinol methylase
MPPGLARRYYREFGDARVILDLGCGDGSFGRYRPSPRLTVHGVDVDSEAVSRAQEYERALCVDLDTHALPYPDSMFDAVLSKDILEHVRDPLAVAREARRVLHPGGTLVASVVMAKPHRVWDDYTHRRGFTLRAARALLVDAGFFVEASWRMGGVPLTARFDRIDLVPHLLRVPLFDALWGSSWELRARRPA